MKLKRSNKPLAGRRPKTGRPDGDTRAAILAAARSVFAQHGLNGTSMREVAKAARVNNAMIYYHFKDKDDLYRSVLRDSFSAITDVWNDPVFTSKTTVRRKIERYVDGFIRFEQGNEDLRRIMAMEFAASAGNITCMCEQYFDDSYVRLVKLFREGMRKGELKKFDPSIAVASLMGIISHNFILLPMAEHVQGKTVNLSPKKFGAFVSDLFFDGLGGEIKQAGIGKGKRMSG
jgi:TetR/AcrR family transcriptional regulator